MDSRDINTLRLSSNTSRGIEFDPNPGFSLGITILNPKSIGRLSISKLDDRTLVKPNYFCNDDELKSLEDNNQIAVTYCGEDGTENETTNPNGAIKNIAGIFNNNKNVLGMMPHPERMIDKYLSGEDGSLFFKNILDNFK